MTRFIRLLALLSLLAGCAGTPAAIPVELAEPPATTSTTSRPVVEFAAQGMTVGLSQVDDCDVLLDYFIDQALEQVGPWGLDGFGGYLTDDTMAAEAAGEDSSDGSSAASESSSTNVQVDGVDEGDIVKATGDLLFVLSSGRLLTFSTADGSIEEFGSLDVSMSFGADQMLLDGDRLVVVSAGFDSARPIDTFESDIAPVGSSLTEVTLIDVSDPADPTMVRRLTLDGSVVTTRLVEGHLRLVLEAHPVGLAWSYPEGSGLRSEREATDANREIIRSSTIENWLPYYVTDAGAEGVVMSCGDVLLPPEPSGLGTLSIFDFDLANGIDRWETASVVAAGSTVYANPERTYVATQRWLDPATVDSDQAFTEHVTRIHRFDTPVGEDLTYVASGDVPGFLLSQFAMDEHDDHLRVASTTAPAWWGAGEDSVSQVTVLATEGDRLATVGTVGGLGQTETIRAVRFMGPVGYVVTFRQTDPLYVIDLSDPTDPEATGELKIPGYSAYLHPVAAGRLLGVGQDADPDTGAVNGLQVSLFDVSDPSAPTRIDTFGLDVPGGGQEAHVFSPIESDHKAFTIAGGVGFVPYEGWSWSPQDESETARFGLIAVDWSDDTLERSRNLSIFEGKPTGDEWGLAPQRTVVKGDNVYAVGHGGITVIDIASGDVVDQVRF